MRPLSLPVPIPNRLSFRPVLPSVTWSTAVRLADFDDKLEQEVNSRPPATAAVRSMN
jgi:hypothetical protein